MSWHRRNIERMVRTHFADRNLNEVLGEATFGEQDGISYIEFEYLQPAPLENRGVDWLDEDVSNLVRGGHGTYWETIPWILATGTFTDSDSKMTYGEREWHKVPGVYMTPQFDAWAGHYSWPCNVFGNKVFYGIGTRVISNNKYLKKTFLHPNRATKEERVYEPRGVVITHVVVSYNRFIEQGWSRARHFLPRCEFVHGEKPVLRKYPDIRISVWGDEAAYDENSGRPLELPTADTDHYIIPFIDTPPHPSPPPPPPPPPPLLALPISSPPCLMDEGDDSDSDETEVSDVDMNDGSVKNSISALSSRALSWDTQDFIALEHRWVSETDIWAKYDLYKKVEEWEVQYALKHRIYSDIVEGNQTELSIAKKKTRNRMKSRRTHNKAVGLPVKGRARASKIITWHTFQLQNQQLSPDERYAKWKALPLRRVRKVRLDPDTRKIIKWKTFQLQHAHLSSTDQYKRWKALPRGKSQTLIRDYKGEPLTWWDCKAKYSDYYEMSDIATWFQNLPRM